MTCGSAKEVTSKQKHSVIDIIGLTSILYFCVFNCDICVSLMQHIRMQVQQQPQYKMRIVFSSEFKTLCIFFQCWISCWLAPLACDQVRQKGQMSSALHLVTTRFPQEALSHNKILRIIFRCLFRYRKGFVFVIRISDHLVRIFAASAEATLGNFSYKVAYLGSLIELKIEIVRRALELILYRLYSYLY